MFVNRPEELEFFDKLLARRRPGPAQLVLLYGRRRVGKTRYSTATLVGGQPTRSSLYLLGG